MENLRSVTKSLISDTHLTMEIPRGAATAAPLYKAYCVIGTLLKTTCIEQCLERTNKIKLNI